MAKSKEKKRKTTVEQRNLNVKLKTISENPDRNTSPIIGYFASGYDPLKNSDDPDLESGSSSGVKVYKNVNSRNPRNPRMQVVVGVNGSEVNFVGTSYSGEATTPQLCNYALGVLDKETGVLKMVPIAANRIFRLEPKVGLLGQAANELEDEAKEELTKEEKADKFKTTTQMYSTKKDIRRDVKREALRQTEVPGMEAEMDQKLNEIKINPDALQATTSTGNSRNIPDYDVEATSADKAYPLDKIIQKGDWDYLLDVFELAQSGSEFTSDVYPSFVRNRVYKLVDVKDESKKREMAGILSYITHLIKYKDRLCMDGVSSAKRHRLPSILSQKFSGIFGSPNDNNKKKMPEDKQKLLISYVLVLTLFADNFRSDPSDIAKDLRMSPLDLRPHYEYLGCKFVREHQVLLATLPVPLVFHTTKRKRRRN